MCETELFCADWCDNCINDGFEKLTVGDDKDYLDLSFFLVSLISFQSGVQLDEQEEIPPTLLLCNLFLALQARLEVGNLRPAGYDEENIAELLNIRYVP